MPLLGNQVHSHEIHGQRVDKTKETEAHIKTVLKGRNPGTFIDSSTEDPLWVNTVLRIRDLGAKASKDGLGNI